MEEECVRPRTATEWVELCLDAVAKMEEANKIELPEPAIPAESATIEEKAAAMDEWAQYKFSQLMASLKGRKGSISAASRSIAYMQALPPLTSRAATKAFIACLAVGLQRKLINGEDVKTLMYTAQLALQAYQPRAKRSPSPSPRHGRQGHQQTDGVLSRVQASAEDAPAMVAKVLEQATAADKIAAPATATPEPQSMAQAWNPTCATCGDITRRAGSCYCCPSCGSTSGCS